MKRLQPFNVFNFAACLLTCAVAALLLPSAAAAAETPPAVTLIVDYGDGVAVHFNAIAWKQGMTVVDALDAVAKLPHGVTYHKRGSGATALVTQIGDVKNLAPGTGDRNTTWMFWVNQKLADEGAGSYQLHAKDAVLWKYTVPDLTETSEP